jgi:hypothetical protein
MSTKFDNYSQELLIQLLIDRENEIFELEKELDTLTEENNSLYAMNKILKTKSDLIPNKKLHQMNLNTISVCSTDIISTTFDYEDDSGIPYFQLPNKNIANDLLIDNGYAISDNFQVKVHLEILS